MCTAVAVLLSDIPAVLMEAHDLERRIYRRGGEPEVRFDWRDPDPLLPIRDSGQLKLVAWGSRDRTGPLPPTAWTWRATVETGGWAWAAPEPVVIPAAYGFERGIWFKVTEGVRGLTVRDPAGRPRAYMICEPPTRYFRVMTRSTRMPWLVEEVI